MKTLGDFDWGYYLENFKGAGRWSVIVKDPSKVLAKDFKLPKGYCLKIFKDTTWQGTSFGEALIIKNIAWINGFAPRARGMITLGEGNHEFTAFILEFVKNNQTLEEKRALIKTRSVLFKQMLADNFITSYQNEHGEIVYNASNWRDGLYLDFGGFQIDKEKYKEKLVKEIIEVTHFGKAYLGGKASYQSVPEWKLDGKRKTDYRIEQLGLEKQEFKGKSVLDIGCNLGMLLHYAKKRGAKELFGYDFPNVIKVAKEFANINLLFDLDFFGQDLTANPPDAKADIVFYLAMSEYLGFPNWLREVTKETLYYEGHANEDKNETEGKLRKLFADVSFLGYTEDRSIRPLFVCRNV